MTALNVLALSGSLREKSYNTALLREAGRLAPAGMTHRASRRSATFRCMMPTSRRAGFPQPVTALSDRVKGADALLIATPEYNFSIPGVLKNVIDWLSRPPLDAALARKPVAIVGAGGRLGSARAQYHLRQVCGCLSMLPVPRPEVFVLNAWDKFDAQGRLKDAADEKQVTDLLAALADWTLLLRARARGPAMIDLYYWPTSNGRKITIMLHEVELPYRIIPVNFKIGEQYAAEFLAHQSEQQDPRDRRSRAPSAAARRSRSSSWSRS